MSAFWSLKEVEEKVKKLEKKVQEQEEEMRGTRELLAQSKKENVVLHAKFKEQASTVETYKRFHEQLNSALQKVKSFSNKPQSNLLSLYIQPDGSSSNSSSKNNSG